MLVQSANRSTSDAGVSLPRLEAASPSYARTADPDSSSAFRWAG